MNTKWSPDPTLKKTACPERLFRRRILKIHKSKSEIFKKKTKKWHRKYIK